MKKVLSLFLLIFAITVFSNEVFSQNKYENAQVANYSTGRDNSATYEHFSFWIDATGKPLEISYYSYLTKGRIKNITFSYAGKTANGKGFKVKAPDGAISSIYVIGNNLRVVNPKARKPRIFRWEYVGPVDGRGTFCTPCVEGPKEAAALIKKHFI